MDSMVFLDDNPFERDLVRSLIPEITVPELPADPSEYVEFLKELNLFETASSSDDDIKRTEQYKAEAGRRLMGESYGSYEDYLKGLKMTAVTSSFDEFHYPRIAQLTQRSNQFNLRTVRYTEEQVRELAKDDRYLTLYFTLDDQFGSYGLISVVVLEKQPESTLFISEWLMSCRVLKRGMEEFVINKIIETAAENGYSRVVGEYIPTSKNSMVADIYEKMGFTAMGEGYFETSIHEFIKRKTYIMEETKNEQG